MVEIREARPEEYGRLGAITLEAYTRLDGHVREPDYEAELADVATRAQLALVLTAVDDGIVVGGVTYVDDPESPLSEHVIDNGASIRMLAVDPAAQGRGVGKALTRACIERARAGGRVEVVLHSTTWMNTAHRLYEGLGFVRDPAHDWTPTPGITLLFFRLKLADG